MTSAGLPAFRHGYLAMPSAQAGDKQRTAALLSEMDFSSLQAAEETHAD